MAKKKKKRMDNDSNSNMAWIKTVLSIAGLLVALGIAWATYGHQIKDNTGDLSIIKPIMIEHEKYIEADKINTEWIKKDIGTIKTTQEKILDKIDELKP